MLDIELTGAGTVTVGGRLDALEAPKAQTFLDAVDADCVLDLSDLEYVSSAGLGVLLKTHKRLAGTGGGLRLVNVRSHIFDIFSYSGFDKLFEITRAAD
jgi:anti-anti-sigma factor